MHEAGFVHLLTLILGSHGINRRIKGFLVYRRQIDTKAG